MFPGSISVFIVCVFGGKKKGQNLETLRENEFLGVYNFFFETSSKNIFLKQPANFECFLLSKMDNSLLEHLQTDSLKFVKPMSVPWNI